MPRPRKPKPDVVGGEGRVDREAEARELLQRVLAVVHAHDLEALKADVQRYLEGQP